MKWFFCLRDHFLGKSAPNFRAKSRFPPPLGKVSQSGIVHFLICITVVCQLGLFEYFDLGICLRERLVWRMRELKEFSSQHTLEELCLDIINEVYGEQRSLKSTEEIIHQGRCIVKSARGAIKKKSRRLNGKISGSLATTHELLEKENSIVCRH